MNFDKITDRRGTNTYKHGKLQEMFGRTDLLPLWVADMDFETPECIVDALRQRIEHPLYGYTMLPDDYWPTVIRWIQDHHQWQVEPEWLTFIPGIVRGIGMAINVLTQPGDKIIIQPPVYHPFRLTPEGNGREVVYNPLTLHDNGHYTIDFQNLETVCDDRCRMLILSNPHNPAGICWDRDTLQRLAHFCSEHRLIVISDEIHCDMALFGHRHIPFASVSDEAANISITFQAPSKTFNIAGIVSSYAIVPNAALRDTFYGWMSANELNEPTLFAPIATLAAYRQGEPWRQAMLRYVEDNILMVEAFLREHLPQVRALRPQASFLVWLDCRGLGLSHHRLVDLFVNKAHLALNDGEMFGFGTRPNCGQGFMRLNVGTPRAILQQALTQLEKAVKEEKI